MRTLRLIGVLLILLTATLGCEKESDLKADKITLSITVDKLWIADNQFNNASKACTFPDSFAPVDSNTYYLTLESIDTGAIQHIVIADGQGSFTFDIQGDNYKLTTTTYADGIVLPITGDNYYWFAEQTIDLGVSRNITVVLENPYSAIVVINNENTILPTPTLSGEPMFVKEDGWYIFSKADGVEPVDILKADGGTVNLNTSYEPAQIYTYMYCEPLSLTISKQSIPFTINNNIQIN